MSQKHFILLFLNICYLAVHFVNFDLQVLMIEFWLKQSMLQVNALNLFPLLLYASILVLSLLAAKNKFHRKSRVFIFILLLFSGFLYNLMFQLVQAPQHALSQIISALPLAGCILYLSLRPSRLLNTNQNKLLPTTDE